MKQILALSLIAVLSSTASAGTICSITGANSKEPLTFDRPLFVGEVNTPKVFIIDDAATSAVEIRLSDMDSFEKWSRVNGKTMVSISGQANGDYGLTVGYVDLKRKSNVLPLIALTTGPVKDSPLQLIAPQKKISVICLSKD